MNDDKPVGERLATLEEAVRNLNSSVNAQLADIKSLVNPKLLKVEQLWEWRQGHEREEDLRDRRLTRRLTIFGISVTVAIAAVNIIIAMKF